MRILVTVGTTRFDSLIKYLDETFAGLDFEFTFQIADGKYEPVNFPFFTFSSDINTYYKESDLVICHAGAGTIYKLLESRKKVIIVPNTERLQLKISFCYLNQFKKPAILILGYLKNTILIKPEKSFHFV